jgi:catechol 2,3-dioxygenase
MAGFNSRIERVELRCSNVEASAEFYGRVVGLELGELGSERAALRAPGGWESLLVLSRAERPGRAPVDAAGLFHTAFRYSERADLAMRLTRLEFAGARLSGAADHGVSEALYLDDPDGIGIELYWDRPRDRWPEPGRGERIRMFTEPLDLAELGDAAAGAAAREPGTGVDVGHIHLKVKDTDEAERFWSEEIGLEPMTRFGPQASFLAWDGYHHHVGVNSWHSRGAAREPADGPGLERVVVRAGRRPKAARTPDGIPVDSVEEPGS